MELGMLIFRRQFPATILVTAIFFMTACSSVSASVGHDELVQLFEDWRAFESPPLVDGAPDYSSGRFEQRQGEYHELRERLTTFDIGSWPIPEQVDWHLIRAKIVEARGDEFQMKDFFDRLNEIDSIPISLARWEMTGLDDRITPADD
jgi:hypothetical protein